jgi:hypothetical protein
MFTDHILTVIDSTRKLEDLWALGNELARHWATGEISEDDYLALRELKEEREAELKAGRGPKPPSAPGSASRRRRHIPHSPDRIASKQRRRDIGQQRWLPPNIANKLTPCELAVASIIVCEIVRDGICSLPNGAIAGMAGTCETMVKNTKRFIRLMGWIKVQERPRRGTNNSKTTLIWALSEELKLWIATRRRRVVGKNLDTPKVNVERKRDGRDLVGREPILKEEERRLPIRRAVPG